MANEQKIDEFIDQRAFAQFERLQRELTENQTGMAKLVQEARNLNRELGGARNITAFGQAQEKVTKSTQQMAQAQERVVKTSQQLAKAEDEVVKATQRNIVSSEEERRLLDSVSGSLEQNIRQRARLRGELSNVRQGLRVLNKETRGVTISTQKYDQRLRSLTDREQQLSAAIQQNTGTIRSQIRENQAAAGSYNQLNQRLIQLRAAYRELNPAERAQLQVGQQIIAQIRATDAEIKRLDASMGIHNRNVGNYRSALAGAIPVFRQFISAFGLVGGIFVFAQAIRNAINTTREFERSNAVLAGVLDTTRDEISALTENAIRLGSTTARTASEVTQLQIAYARLGFTQREILELTEDSINGSIALNAELDETASLVGAVVRTFNDLSTTDAGMILDQMTAATQRSALNFATLQKALPNVAGAANEAGIEFTELLALLGRLADAGIDASMSSTALRNIFIRSAAQGLSYNQILDEIANSTDRLTAANDEFGVRAAVPASVLSRQIGTLKEFQDELENSGGTAERVAREQLATMDGALKLLTSAWEGLILEINSGEGVIGSVAVGAIRALTFVITELTSGIRQLEETWESLTGGVRESNKEVEETSRFWRGFTIAVSEFNRLVIRGLVFGSLTQLRGALAGLGNVINNFGRLFQNSFRTIGRAISQIDLNLLNPAETAASFDRAFETLRQGLSDNFTILEESYRLGYRRVIESVQKGQRDVAAATGAGETSAGGGPGGPTPIDPKELEKQRKAAEKQQQLIANAASELAIFRANVAADASKRILEDESRSFEDRLNALNSYRRERQTLIQAEQAKELLDKDLTEDDRIRIEEEAQQKLIELRVDAANQSEQILKDQLSREDTLRVQSQQRRLNLIEQQRNEEIDALNRQFAGGNLPEEEYQKQRLAIQERFNQLYAQQEIRNVQEIIAIQNQRGVDTAEAERQLAELKAKYSQQAADEQIADAERVAERERELTEARRQMQDELLQLTTTLFTSQFEREKNRLQERLEEIETQKQAEIEAVNATTASEEEKAARISIIEANKQAERERIEQQQRQLDLQRARFDKAQSISSIVVNTARAVVQALPNIPLSIIVGAIGAAQLATALAQPLPRFEKGTKSAPGGPAVVGEKGSELVVNPQGKLGITPSVPTLIDLQKGSQVIPNHELMNMIAQPQLLSMTSGQGIDVERIVKSQDSGTRRIEKALNGKKEHRTILTDRGLKGIYRNGHSWREYRGRNL